MPHVADRRAIGGQSTRSRVEVDIGKRERVIALLSWMRAICPIAGAVLDVYNKFSFACVPAQCLMNISGTSRPRLRMVGPFHKNLPGTSRSTNRHPDQSSRNYRSNQIS